MRIQCNECGKVMIVPDCKGHLKHCSVSCLVESRKLDPAQIAILAKMHSGNRRAVAKVLDMPYPTFYNKLQKQCLNNLFMRRGGFYGPES